MLKQPLIKKLSPLLLICLVACGGTPVREGELVPPFDLAARRSAEGMTQGNKPCNEIPAPVHDIEGVDYYADADRSIIDPRRMRSNSDNIKPLTDFLRAVIDDADRYAISDPVKPAFAACAINALYAWSSRDAMLGSVNAQGALERQWVLGGLAMAYLKLRNAPNQSPAHTAKLANIEAWLKQLGDAVRNQYDGSNVRDNRLYWAGFAVGATAIAVNDRAAFEWSLKQYRVGLDEIRDNGALPLELERKGRALHYHLFALSPLVLIAELARNNGVDLYAERNGRIRLLATLVLDGLNDSKIFAGLAGIEQSDPMPPRERSDLAWMEPYNARFPDARFARWLIDARPVRDPRYGGNVTFLFGVPLKK